MTKFGRPPRHQGSHMAGGADPLLLTGAEIDHIGDDVPLYFDTAKTMFIKWNSVWGWLLQVPDGICTAGPMYLYANADEDGTGIYAPSIDFAASGYMLLDASAGTQQRIRLKAGEYVAIGNETHYIKITNAGVLSFVGTAALGGNVPCGLYRFNDMRVEGGAALPGADVTRRGQLFLLEGGAGVADEMYVCRKNAVDAYEWLAL